MDRPRGPSGGVTGPNIYQLQAKNDVDGLIQALRYPDPSTRRGAAAALRALSAWQAVPALQSALSVENDWQTHATISAALQYLDHDIHVELMIKNHDVKGLVKMLNSNRPDDVMTACEALATLGDKLATEPLIMVFRNLMMPPKVRLAAAEALLRLESAPAVVTLLGALRKGEPSVRRNAAAVLGQLQAVWAVEPLIKVLEDPQPIVAQTAAAALRRIGTPEAVQAAIRYEQAQAAADAARATAEAPLRTTGELTPPPSTGGTGMLKKSDTGRLSSPKPNATGRLPVVPRPAMPSSTPTKPLPEPEAIQQQKRSTRPLPKITEDSPPAETKRIPTLSRLGLRPTFPPDLDDPKP